jgi:hypothetical protein
MDNIESLTINYYADPNSSTNLGASAATTATTISATINGKKNTVGREFTTSASVRATKINNLGVE